MSIGSFWPNKPYIWSYMWTILLFRLNIKNNFFFCAGKFFKKISNSQMTTCKRNYRSYFLEIANFFESLYITEVSYFLPTFIFLSTPYIDLTIFIWITYQTFFKVNTYLVLDYQLLFKLLTKVCLFFLKFINFYLSLLQMPSIYQPLNLPTFIYVTYQFFS